MQNRKLLFIHPMKNTGACYSRGITAESIEVLVPLNPMSLINLILDIFLQPHYA